MPSPADLYQTGNALYAEGKASEAAAAYRRAVELNPEFSDAHNNLGNALLQTGDFSTAIESYKRAIQIRPDFPEAQHNLAAALQRLERYQEAAEAYQNALRYDPNLPAEVHNQLGIVLSRCGKFDAAADAFQQAINHKTDFAEAYNNLANALHKLERAAEAVAIYRQALLLRPNSAEIFNNLGNLLKEMGQLDHALACQHRATELRPDYADAFNNLANTLKDTGRLDQALECYDAAIAINPNHIAAHSGKVYTLHFHPSSTPDSLFKAHLEWNTRHAEPLAKYMSLDSSASPGKPGDGEGSPQIRKSKSEIRNAPTLSLPRSTRGGENTPPPGPLPAYRERGQIQSEGASGGDPSRRLRVGYVSPDFRGHVVGRFLLPLFLNHDHEQFEILAYASVAKPDSLTARFREHTDVWRDVLTLSDEELARRIYEDEVDILVDLTMHMAGSRLLTFARKPAPVQITYLAYCSTTGLDAMDYRFTDAHLDPPGVDTNYYSEESAYLGSYWCYEPPEHCPDVGPLPRETNRQITFGSLNNFCKISSAAVETWATLLQRVRNSRLILHAHAGTHREQLLARFAELGISATRIEFVPFASLNLYLQRYNQIDIGLDPFPYAGGTTTCDALWMGVPVIALAGQTAVSRSGTSILGNLNLNDLVTHSTEEYIDTAARLAGNVSRLRELRSTMRSRMQASPLMNARAFARDVESAYRKIWIERCADG